MRVEVRFHVVVDGKTYKSYSAGEGAAPGVWEYVVQKAKRKVELEMEREA